MTGRKTYHWHFLDADGEVRMQPDMYATRHAEAMCRMIEIVAPQAYIGTNGEAHIHWQNEAGDKGHLRIMVSDVTEDPAPVRKARRAA